MRDAGYVKHGAGRNGLPAPFPALLCCRETAVHLGYRRATGPARGQGTRPPIAAAAWREPRGGQWRELRRRFGHHGEYGAGNLRRGGGYHYQRRSPLGPKGSHGVARERAPVREATKLSARDAWSGERAVRGARVAAGGDPQPPGPHLYAVAGESVPRRAGGGSAAAPDDEDHLH